MTPAEMASRMRTLSGEMVDLGVAMDYCGGFSQVMKNGQTLVDAGHVMESWANWMDAEIVAKKEPENAER